MAVTIKPMPRAFLKICPKFRPGHPPIFDGDPTPDDFAEALALFAELDVDSQSWYKQNSRLFAV